MISSLSMGPFVSGTGNWASVQRGTVQPQASAAAAGTDFGSILLNLATSAVDTLKQGESAAAAGITGAMPVQQVVEQVLAAERTLQAAVAIRDKMVGAYLEVSRMQI